MNFYWWIDFPISKIKILHKCLLWFIESLFFPFYFVRRYKARAYRCEVQTIPLLWGGKVLNKQNQHFTQKVGCILSLIPPLTWTSIHRKPQGVNSVSIWLFSLLKLSFQLMDWTPKCFSKRFTDKKICWNRLGRCF